MKRIIVTSLKTVGIYSFLLSIKKWWDKKTSQKNEALNHSKRVIFYSQFLNSGDLVFDVGANVGNRVQAFLEIGCKVVAVEPQQSCVKILNQKFGSKITVEHVGLAGEEGEMEMYIADESTISTFSKDFIDKTKDNKFKRNNWEHRELVKISTLDNLIAKYGQPKFCKIDVEGFESEVLKGLSASIPFISFEYNVPEMLSNTERCLSLLNQLPANYLYNYSTLESMELKLNKWVSFNEFNEFVHTKEFEKTDFGDVYAKASQ